MSHMPNCCFPVVISQLLVLAAAGDTLIYMHRLFYYCIVLRPGCKLLFHRLRLHPSQNWLRWMRVVRHWWLFMGYSNAIWVPMWVAVASALLQLEHDLKWIVMSGFMSASSLAEFGLWLLCGLIVSHGPALRNDKLIAEPPIQPPLICLHLRNTWRQTHDTPHRSPHPPTIQNKSGSNNLIQFDWPHQLVWRLVPQWSVSIYPPFPNYRPLPQQLQQLWLFIFDERSRLAGPPTAQPHNHVDPQTGGRS